MVSKSFPQLLEELSSSKDTTEIIKTQKLTLNRYEEANEMLRQFNELSEHRYKELFRHYSDHMKTLVSLKKDLDSCHKRIRSVKAKLKDQYPESFSATAEAMQELQERYDLEDRLKFNASQEDIATSNIENDEARQKTLSDNETLQDADLTNLQANSNLFSSVSDKVSNQSLQEKSAEAVHDSSDLNIGDDVINIEKTHSDESGVSIISTPRSDDNPSNPHTRGINICSNITETMTNSPSDLIVNISITSSTDSTREIEKSV